VNYVKILSIVLVICCLSLVGAIVGMLAGAILVPLKFIDGTIPFNNETPSPIKDSSVDQI
jgi:hypothetical protein